MRRGRLAMALLATAWLAAGAAQAEKAPPKGLELYTLDCGRIAEPDADYYSDDGAYKGQARTLVVPCFLIRHPKGDLVWDTGLPETIADLPGGTDPKEGVTVSRKLTDQLKQIGLTPADIEYVSVSHSHYDHIGNAGLFAGSTWIVDADERAYAFRPQARARTDAFPRYAALETAKTIQIQGDGDYDVFGDGSVTIVQAPGHTPGHTVLLVRLKSGPVLLTGDMWHMPESRAARRVPRFNTDRAQTLKSMDKVEALAKATGARVVVEHVAADIDAMPKFPEPLR
jgi:glyoxylase-like metal-dependent hydrolase (beta-lactamase superfamily II)